MHFQPASEKSQSKQVEYVFSLRKPLSAGKPGKSEVTNSVFSGHSSKAEKSTFFLRKSARNCPREKVVRSQKSAKPEKSVYVEKKGQFLKDFSKQICLFFPFQLCPLTTEAMGLGGLRANFLSQWRQRKCGRKDCQKHISRPKRIGVCYGFGVLSFSLFSVVCFQPSGANSLRITIPLVFSNFV